jgi:two-component system sensor histidine kinase KdpD
MTTSATPARPCTEKILAATAHELRLPLSHIKGFVTSLRRTDVEWDDETRSEFLAEIDVETDRLARLVESLLATGTPDRSIGPRADLVFTHPASVVGGALHRIRGLLGDRPVQREVPSSLPVVRMDADKMERVLANLIHNAIKYSPPGTAIGISARITDDEELEFSVEDEGPGIPAEDRERIFEPFFRNQAAQQSHANGNGLGLAICESIVLAHHGRIQVIDRPGGGARFSVFLSARPPTGRLENSCGPKDGLNDRTEHSRRGRRGADAQAPFLQPESKRLRGMVGGRRYGGVKTDRGSPVRPVAA